MHKVRFYESERGWGSDTWVNEYKTKEEAEKVVEEIEKEYGGKGQTPDYYIIATYLGKD